jgi:hypothetical protein
MKQAILAKIKCKYLFCKTIARLLTTATTPTTTVVLHHVKSRVRRPVRLVGAFCVPYIFCLLVVASFRPSVCPVVSPPAYHLTAAKTRYVDDDNDDYDNNDAEGDAICHDVTATRRRQH